jgi:hypothetical protein
VVTSAGSDEFRDCGIPATARSHGTVDPCARYISVTVSGNVAACMPDEPVAVTVIVAVIGAADMELAVSVTIVPTGA